MVTLLHLQINKTMFWMCLWEVVDWEGPLHKDETLHMSEVKDMFYFVSTSK